MNGTAPRRSGTLSRPAFVASQSTLVSRVQITRLQHPRTEDLLPQLLDHEDSSLGKSGISVSSLPTRLPFNLTDSSPV